MRTSQRVRKAVIPAAGFGTRFLPATKAMPKEMLPIVDKPVIQYVVEECVAAGIEDIIIVTGWHKRSVEDHFDYPFELEKRLEEAGKVEALEEIRAIANLANFIYLRQKGPMGNGTPVLNARHLIGDEPFAVIWGDEFIHAQPARLKQCIDFFHESGATGVVSALRIDEEDTNRYGIANGDEERPGVIRLKSIVEKPKPGTAPSQLAVLGAYVFTTDLLGELKYVQPGKGGELWLVDAINALAKKKPVYALEIKNARYYDCGNKVEYLKANIEFGLKHPETAEELHAYLKELSASL